MYPIKVETNNWLTETNKHLGLPEIVAVSSSLQKQIGYCINCLQPIMAGHALPLQGLVQAATMPQGRHCASLAFCSTCGARFVQLTQYLLGQPDYHLHLGNLSLIWFGTNQAAHFTAGQVMNSRQLTNQLTTVGGQIHCLGLAVTNNNVLLCDRLIVTPTEAVKRRRLWDKDTNLLPREAILLCQPNISAEYASLPVFSLLDMAIGREVLTGHTLQLLRSN